MEKVEKGYTCECGKFHKFSAYVYAHYDVELVHACDCGRKNTLIGGCVSHTEQKGE